MTPTVSILIDNYNYARFLRAAIDSALAQTYPHVEVIVVDDGSTDESREIIRSYGDRIRPVLKANGGQASAFNAGFAACRGGVVALLDADDYLAPHAVARIVAACQDGAGIVHHHLQRVDSAGLRLGYEPPGHPLDSGDVLGLQLSRGVYRAPPTSGLAYRRELLEKIMPVPEAAFPVYADTYLLFAAPFFGPVAAIEETLGYYRVHGSNAYSHRRRLWTRDRLGLALRDIAQRHELIRRMAAEWGLTVPSPDAWVEGEQLFQQFLYRCSGPAADRPGDGADSIRRIARQLRAEGAGAGKIFRFALLGWLAWRGSDFLRRRVYPNLFPVRPA